MANVQIALVEPQKIKLVLIQHVLKDHGINLAVLALQEMKVVEMQML